MTFYGDKLFKKQNQKITEVKLQSDVYIVIDEPNSYFEDYSQKILIVVKQDFKAQLPIFPLGPSFPLAPCSPTSPG